MEICYCKDRALRDEVCPKALHRDNWRGQVAVTARRVYTNFPGVRDSYEAAGVEVVWLNKPDPEPVKASKAKAPAKPKRSKSKAKVSKKKTAKKVPDQNELRDSK